MEVVDAVHHEVVIEQAELGVIARFNFRTKLNHVVVALTDVVLDVPIQLRAHFNIVREDVVVDEAFIVQVNQNSVELFFTVVMIDGNFARRKTVALDVVSVLLEFIQRVAE